MKDLELNKKHIYKLALEIKSQDKAMSDQKAVVKAIAKCTENNNPIKILGNAYLDYMNYKERFYNRRFDEFDSYFELVYEKARKILPPARKKNLGDILKENNKDIVNLVICSRIAKDYNLLGENIEKYEMINKIKNTESD